MRYLKNAIVATVAAALAIGFAAPAFATKLPHCRSDQTFKSCCLDQGGIYKKTTESWVDSDGFHHVKEYETCEINGVFYTPRASRPDEANSPNEMSDGGTPQDGSTYGSAEEAQPRTEKSQTRQPRNSRRGETNYETTSAR